MLPLAFYGQTTYRVVCLLGAMLHSSAEPARNEAWRWAVWGAVGLAITPMVALHVLQPELDLIAQPVSFYVWGRHGWLLSVSLAGFGVALLALVGAATDERAAWPRRILALVGFALLLTALVPSDRWFPWEGPPSVSGLVHAAAAMLAPVLLLWPMATLAPPRHPRIRQALPWIVRLYSAALIGSAGSLALGFLRDGPPPWIGLMERVLAVAAMSWVCVVAWPARPK